MRVLLIYPWEDEVFPPPAIGYLRAVLEEYDIDVKVCNLYQALAEQEQFDITAVSFHSFSVRYARQLRDKFKGYLICGGHHPSALPDQMLSIGYDQVVIGEGENAILEIVEGNRDKKLRATVSYYSDIDDLPIPDYSNISFSGTMGIPIISSRGCPFSCSFCASTNFWSHKYKTRSSDNVLAEIDKRKSQGYTTWMFEDDNFTANKKRMFEICAGLDGKYFWQCTSRAEVLDRETCKELYRAGCRNLWLGIESLSQEALNRCNKHTNVERMLSGIEAAYNAGIGTVSLFIVRLPGDTLQDIQITHNKRVKSKITEYGANIAWILPGTDIHVKAKEKGFDDSVYLDSGAPFYTYEQSYETLQNWSKLI